MKRTALVLLALMSMLLLIAACGGSDEAATSLTIDADSFSFDPSDVTVAADTDISVTLTNLSDVDEHEWVIVKLGHEIAAESDFDEDDVLYEVEAVPPGETETGSFNVPAGTYQLICALEGHFDGGMVGELVVTSG